jgi:hypothetical protein
MFTQNFLIFLDNFEKRGKQDNLPLSKIIQKCICKMIYHSDLGFKYCPFNGITEQ